MTNTSEKELIVVYADDDPDDIELVTEAFEHYGANVTLKTFSDGLTILSFLKNLSVVDNIPCLIILDINMPGMNGKECLKQIRHIDLFKDVPVVLFTASVSDRDKEFAKLYRAGFITKPLSTVQMEVIAANFIEHCNSEIQKLIIR
jgi:CheY-like chemotaxis protein